MSRTADMLAIIARQDGSEVARERCTVLMRVISGEMTMEAAADELGISASTPARAARPDGGDVGGEPGAAGARLLGGARTRCEGIEAHRRAGGGTGPDTARSRLRADPRGDRPGFRRSSRIQKTSAEQSSAADRAARRARRRPRG